MAANEGVVKAIVSFNRDDSDTVYLGLSYDLRPNILMPYFFFSLPAASRLSRVG